MPRRSKSFRAAAVVFRDSASGGAVWPANKVDRHELSRIKPATFGRMCAHARRALSAKFEASVPVCTWCGRRSLLCASDPSRCCCRLVGAVALGVVPFCAGVVCNPGGLDFIRPRRVRLFFGRRCLRTHKPGLPDRRVGDGPSCCSYRYCHRGTPGVVIWHTGDPRWAYAAAFRHPSPCR